MKVYALFFSSRLLQIQLYLLYHNLSKHVFHQLQINVYSLKVYVIHVNCFNRTMKVIPIGNLFH